MLNYEKIITQILKSVNFLENQNSILNLFLREYDKSWFTHFKLISTNIEKHKYIYIYITKHLLYLIKNNQIPE